ncbi:MAG: hypothetical protein KatS3mg017_0882 [Fimbriimonadales bacterium]|nr:MAG: hypothetical protein KatS3mg017_0882 [Fimbriimonadales bacterium]
MGTFDPLLDILGAAAGSTTMASDQFTGAGRDFPTRFLIVQQAQDACCQFVRGAHLKSNPCLFR